MNTNNEDRFLMCSKIIEIALAAIMLLSLITSTVKQRQKKYEDAEQISLEQLNKKKSPDYTTNDVNANPVVASSVEPEDRQA
jgi:hypothetical protein